MPSGRGQSSAPPFQVACQAPLELTAKTRTCHPTSHPRLTRCHHLRLPNTTPVLSHVCRGRPRRRSTLLTARAARLHVRVSTPRALGSEGCWALGGLGAGAWGQGKRRGPTRRPSRPGTTREPGMTGTRNAGTLVLHSSCLSRAVSTDSNVKLVTLSNSLL